MTVIFFGVGTISIAPPGTDPDDTESWQPVGVTTEPIHLTLAAPEPPPLDLLTPRTITLAASSRGGLTWFGHRALSGRAHPRARRIKTAYHHRRR